MTRFLKHLAYLLLVIPVLLIVVLFSYCELNSEVVEQYGVLLSVTITESDGTVYREEYDYNTQQTIATIEYYENDTLLRVEEHAITENDPLLYDTYEILAHPAATASATEREENGSYVTIRYYSADGTSEGWSELIYNSYERLGKQEDFAADGTLLRTTSRQYFSSSKSVLNFGDTTTPTE